MGNEWALGWSKMIAVGGVSPRSRDPVMLMGPEGILHLLRVAEREGEAAHLLHQTSADFATFSSPVTIPCDWESPRQLQGAIDAQGQVHLVWIDRAGDASGVFHSVWDLQSQRCSSPVLISSPATRIASPQLTVVEDGRALIAWVEGVGRTDSVYLAVLRQGSLEREAILLGEQTIGIKRIQFVVVQDRIWLASTSSGRLPEEEHLAFQSFSLEGVPLSPYHPVGTLAGNQPRAFCLTADPSSSEVYLAFVGKTEEWGGRFNQILLAQYSLSEDQVEVRPLIQRTHYVGSPWIILDSRKEIHVVWEEGLRSFDIWYGRLSSLQGELTSGCLSPCDGSSHFFPRIQEDPRGELHIVWIMVEQEEGQEYTLLYRNTVYPVPLSFWKRIGLPEKGAVAGLLYGLVFSMVMASWLVPLLNLGSLAAVLGIVLALRRFVIPSLFRSFPTLSLLLPFAMLFCLFSPANPLFINPPLIRLVSSPLWFEGALFLGSTVLALFTVKLFRIDLSEGVALVGVLVFWTACFAALATLPAVLLGVYK